jgi:tRNA pseudouridine synthase 9
MRPSPIALRPSPKVLEYLLRRDRIPASDMALVAVDPAVEQAEVLSPPPKIVTTPCDPWPRPYIIDGNLRRVKPYHFTYNTNCKQRWRGRGILDIFQDEFRDRPLEYYVSITYESDVSIWRAYINLVVLESSNREWCDPHKWKACLIH